MTSVLFMGLTDKLYDDVWRVCGALEVITDDHEVIGATKALIYMGEGRYQDVINLLKTKYLVKYPDSEQLKLMYCECSLEIGRHGWIDMAKDLQKTTTNPSVKSQIAEFIKSETERLSRLQRQPVGIRV